MDDWTRRRFLQVSGGGLIGSILAASRAAAQDEDESAKPRTMEQWLNEWMAVAKKKAPGGILQLSRFADPMYFLLKEIGWNPNPGQVGYEKVRVPAGFVTDFASIPSAFWSRLRPDGDYAYAAVIHDYLYWTQATTRESADTILKFAMEDFRISNLTIRTIYTAVHLGGGPAWNRNAELKAQGERRILKAFPTDPTVRWEQWKAMPGVFVDP